MYSQKVLFDVNLLFVIIFFLYICCCFEMLSLCGSGGLELLNAEITGFYGLSFTYFFVILKFFKTLPQITSGWGLKHFC